jgi:hypothetical protein
MLISVLLNSILDKIQNAPKKTWWLGVASVFLAVILINGITLVPPQHYQRLAENPFIVRTDIAADNYWQENLLLPAFAYFTHLNSPVTFNLLCFAIVAGGFALFAWWSYSRWGAVPAFLSTTLLITGPLTTVLLSWLGTPDGLSFVLTIPFLFLGSSPVLLVLSALGSLNHVTVPAAAVLILVLRWCARDGTKPRHILATVIGGGAGYALARLILALLQIPAWSRFDNYFNRDLASWTGMMARNLPITVFSLFNIQWFLVIILVVMFFRKDKLFYSAVVVILLFNCVFAYFSNDSTRNFALVSWGVLVESAIHSYRLAADMEESHRKELLQAWTAVGLASFFAPRFYSWNGSIYASPLDVSLLRLGALLKRFL